MRDNKYIYGETFSAEAPRPTAVVYDILSRHLAKAETDKSASHNALNDIYKVLGSSEQEVDAVLVEFEQAGTISQEDTLVLVVLLAVSRTLGPDLDFLRQAILTGNFNVNELNSRLRSSGLDSGVSDYLQTIIAKLVR